MSKLLLLCYQFFKTGLLSVGGGLATLPFLSKMATTHPDWFTLTDLTNMVAIAESTPGPIGINMATYAGFSTAGIPGALVATLSLVCPSFLVILLVYRVLEKFKSSPVVTAVFDALRPASTGLILAAFLSLALLLFFPEKAAGSCHLNLPTFFLFAGFFGVMQLPKIKKLHPIIFILAGALLGILLGL